MLGWMMLCGSQSGRNTSFLVKQKTAYDVMPSLVGSERGIRDRPLFEIDRDGTEICIPMVDAFIKKVDRENNTIEVETPEGLKALYI